MWAQGRPLELDRKYNPLREYCGCMAIHFIYLFWFKLKNSDICPSFSPPKDILDVVRSLKILKTLSNSTKKKKSYEIILAIDHDSKNSTRAYPVEPKLNLTIVHCL